MKVLFSILLAVFMLLPNTACTSDDLTLNAYKTLETSAITYDTVMSAATDMRQSGKLSDAQWATLYDAALVYYESYQTAVSALALYAGVVESGGAVPDKEQVQSLVDTVSSGVADLLSCAISLGITVKEVTGNE